jgi:hypothetical protein
MTKQIWAVIFIGVSLIFLSAWLTGERNVFGLIGLAGGLMLLCGAPFLAWREWERSIKEIKSLVDDEEDYDFCDDEEDEADEESELEDFDDELLTAEPYSAVTSADTGESSGRFDFTESYQITGYIEGLDDRCASARDISGEVYDAAKWLLHALIRCAWRCFPTNEQNLGTVLRMINEEIDSLETYEHHPEFVTVLDFMLGERGETPIDEEASEYYGFYESAVKYGDFNKLKVLRYCRARLLPISYGFAYERKPGYLHRYKWVLKSPNFYRSAMCRVMDRVIEIQDGVMDLADNRPYSETPLEPQNIVER